MSIVVDLNRPNYAAQVQETEDGAFVLVWNDHGPNEWKAAFETLGAAVVALGVLDVAPHVDNGYATQAVLNLLDTLV